MAIRKLVFFILSVFNVCAQVDNSTTLPTPTLLLENLPNVTEYVTEHVIVPKEQDNFSHYSTTLPTPTHVLENPPNLTHHVTVPIEQLNCCQNTTTFPTPLLENSSNVTVPKEHVKCCQNSTTLPTQTDFLTHLFNVTEHDLNDFAEHFYRVTVPKEDVKFFQYSPNSNQTTEITSTNSLNPEHPTKIFIHGWWQKANSSWIGEMAFLYHQKDNYNIIAVDWSKHAAVLPGYNYSASATQSVGLRVGEFILNVQKKIPNFLKSLHLIGFSLGGHIAGFAGKLVKKDDGSIDRITGLDVAGPLFEIPSPKPSHLRLDRTDAVVVDLIHTNIGLYGVKNNYGTADFYVNKGGPIQPGCLTSVCSHNYALTVFSQSIKDPKRYEAISCSNLLEFSLGFCKRNLKATMGDEVTRHASGTYYL